MTTPFVAIVVAAGSGERLGAYVPKALVILDDRPLVRHAVDALVMAGCTDVVVTIPAGRRADVEDALAGMAVPYALVEGGATRQDSVRIALGALPDDADLVLVHDAARPLVPADVVTRVADAVAAGADAVVPAVPVSDSLRRVHDHGSEVVDRAGLWHVQTPQGFRGSVLRRGHEAALSSGVNVTDDAAAAELVGAEVLVVPGDRAALKVTDPFDLAVARLVRRERRTR